MGLFRCRFPYLRMLSQLTRSDRTARRNQRIRDAFYNRYTLQPRPRLHTREYVVAQLGEEFCLSTQTIEDILWTKTR